MRDDTVDVIVREKIVDGRLIADVLEENVERLQDLNADVPAVLLPHVVEKVVEDASFETVAKQASVSHGRK